jgi:tetratricopeptide (TPR) repeat protein
MASSPRIEELKKKFDENPRRYFAPLANEFRKTGDFDQAILICQEFLPQQPGHMSGHIVFGQALLDEARSVFETALTLDPENLIALRHLGDISRAGGDIEGARGWYRRVLDADPRNEEIASLLASLDEPATVAWTSPTPKSSPVVETPESHAAPPTAPAPSPAAARENPLETARAESQLLDFDALMNEAAAASAASPSRSESAAAPESDLLELEESEITFGEPHAAPADDLGVERAQETPVGFEDMSSLPSGDASAFPTLEGLESTSFTPPDSLAPARGEPNVTREEPQAVESAFDNFELASSTEEPAERAPSRVEERPAAPPPAAPEPAPHAHDEAHARASRPVASGFVTETMAELYVQQGHVSEAIAVYQQLVQRYPGDEVLRARLVELETTASEAATTEMPVAETASRAPTREPDEELASTPVALPTIPEPPTLATDTPTIRDFLSAIASYRPGSEAAPAEESVEEHPAVVDEYAAPTAVVDETTLEEETIIAAPPATESESSGSFDEEPVAPPDDTEVSGGDLPFIDVGEDSVRETAPSLKDTGVGGSIDALFTGAEASDADEEAASRLAGAFARGESEHQARGEGDQPMAGNPARRAQDELSLDHVFRERANVADRGQPAFSFDQFFSQNAGERAGAAPADQTGAPTASPDDDIQQFNAWLEGLKKT